MTLYAVGDLQGCLEPLKKLLKHVRFKPGKDELWLTGDLVNRGPDSIGCLEFVHSLGDSAKTVLGNHDLHVLALYELGIRPKDDDILNTLSYPNIKPLMKWLAKQPLLIRDKDRKLLMTHAGIPPIWSDKEAREMANEVADVLKNKKTRIEFFEAMYGNEPAEWSDDLKGNDRLRYIVNAYTRMRFCSESSELEFKLKSAPKKYPEGLRPWFQWEKKRKHRIIFGHWAALMGHTHDRNIIGLDTGYVWGNHLTLMDMDTNQRYCCDTNKKISEYDELEFECLPKSGKLT